MGTAMTEPVGNGVVLEPHNANFEALRFLQTRDESTGRDIAHRVDIVVVDDSPADAWLIGRTLRENGVDPRLFVAKDGDEAFGLFDLIDATQLPCPQLVVLDLNLPGKDGFEVLRRVRLSPLLQAKPVVICSSSNAAADRVEAARLGATLYVRKPLDLKELLDIGRKLAQILAGRQSDSSRESP